MHELRGSRGLTRPHRTDQEDSLGKLKEQRLQPMVPGGRLKAQKAKHFHRVPLRDWELREFVTFSLVLARYHKGAPASMG